MQTFSAPLQIKIKHSPVSPQDAGTTRSHVQQRPHLD